MIRLATKNDAQAISALCINVWIETYSYNGVEPVHAEYVLENFSCANVGDWIKNHITFVALSDSQAVVGVIVINDNNEIVTLYVHSCAKGQGVGKALIEQARKSQKENSTHRPLFLTCWEGNDSAIAFYQKVGFIQAGETYFELGTEQHRNIIFRDRK